MSDRLRTDEEIVAWCEDRMDLGSWQREVLVDYASPSVGPGLCEQYFRNRNVYNEKPCDRDTVIAEMRDYMSFAWEKAYDHRGLSASRSLYKMQAWLWLLGDDELLVFAEDADNYVPYGTPILRKISEKYDFYIPGEEEDEEEENEGDENEGDENEGDDTAIVTEGIHNLDCDEDMEDVTTE